LTILKNLRYKGGFRKWLGRKGKGMSKEKEGGGIPCGKKKKTKKDDENVKAKNDREGRCRRKERRNFRKGESFLNRKGGTGQDKLLHAEKKWAKKS